MNELGQPDRGNRCIMVIDDSPTVRKIIEIVLRRKGYEVCAFNDFVAAAQSIQAHEIPIPNLLFLDINLPKMNGYEVARYVRTQRAWNHTPIIMISGHDGVVERLKARLAKTQDFLPKPFLTQTIRDVADGYLQKRENHLPQFLPAQ